MKRAVPPRVQDKAAHSRLKKRNPARMRGVNLKEMAAARSHPARAGFFSRRYFREKRQRERTKILTWPLTKLFWTRFSERKKQRIKRALKRTGVWRES